MSNSDSVTEKAMHTPGPWAIHPPVRGYAHSVMARHTTGSRIACADIPEGLDADGEDSLANARLVAAAPDLLAAAQSALDWCKQGGPCDWALITVWRDELAAAIASAKGQP